MNPIITLTTDFGTKDGFVGQMKGVILGINPNAVIIDATHEIEPFSVREGALVLKGLSRYFPAEAVHVAVVDPGVGSSRRPVALKAKEQVWIGPNNGLFSLLIDNDEPWEMREIRNPLFVLSDVHPTFHGRDVFAPAAARLSTGEDFSGIGPLVEDPVRVSLPSPNIRHDVIDGEVIYIDRFGNLTVNVEVSMLTQSVRRIEAGNRIIKGMSRFFAEVPPGRPLALINSFGYVEIAVNQGDASKELGMGIGDPVTIFYKTSTGS